MPFNPHNDRVARELYDANHALHYIGEQLRELDQPPEVRAARQAERAKRARRQAWAVRLVLGAGAAWVVFSLVLGRAGQRLFGTLLGLAWDALGVLIVLGAAVWIVGAVVRAGRTVVGAGRGEGAKGGR